MIEQSRHVSQQQTRLQHLNIKKQLDSKSQFVAPTGSPSFFRGQKGGQHPPPTVARFAAPCHGGRGLEEDALKALD